MRLWLITDPSCQGLCVLHSGLAADGGLWLAALALPVCSHHAVPGGTMRGQLFGDRCNHSAHEARLRACRRPRRRRSRAWAGGRRG